MKNMLETIGKLADKSGIVYISYVDADGFPVTKAMLQHRERVGIREFWFTTNTSSNKVACFRRNAKAGIYFVDQNSFRGVSLVGTMEVLEDAAAKEWIWREGDTMYYAGGITDPDYCVLRFTASKGRYYHHFKSEDFVIE